ncbi:MULTISPECIES: capsule assembly Wzi family protein [Acidobacteriaceae]|uniref:capsule assembly Wzi family protein n=1 Tax=Acidobacteriaceae TaxID=204434 RepID=UPI0020B1534F|nr:MULTISPECIES: capsule assembly Wzi family protein [Acidobacteriaceae]MDW5265154.1 capsule assembly Wzi family protein [Edaphobacter sp.]
MTLSLQAARFSNPQDGPQASASNMASTYVPIESWVYPTFERLAAEGYLPAAFFSLRPWTRMDCARLVDEAEDLVDKDEEQIAAKPAASDAPALLASLKEEFAVELARRAGAGNVEFRLESLDQRVTVIAGRPLTDGFHFGETLVNDDGRPFAEGANLYSGVSFRATAGPFAAYVKTELQRVPSAPVPDGLAQQQIAAADFTSSAAAGPISGFLRGRLLEANVSFTVSNNQFTFGRQSLWWGPARSGATLFSNNAEPIDMLRYDRVRPFLLPDILKLLGPIRAQVLVGRLSGTQYVRPTSTLLGTSGVALRDQPFIHGEKISFKPTPNFEFSVSRTVIFGGAGSPVNSSTFLRSIFSVGTKNGTNDPGDRRIAFDAQYRIPGLRNCLTGYFDGFSDDQPFPLAYPTESAWLSGFFLRCVPRLPRLTLRAEGLLSPHRDLAFPGFFYFNVHYLSGYTNNRQLIGSWIGREGDGEQAWATWHLSPRSSVELSGRSMTVNREFLRGGTLRDLRATVDIALRPEWQLCLEEQTERWRFPLLFTTPQHNTAFTFQLSYRPLGRIRQ